MTADPVTASDAMVKRVRLMAEFIRKRHADDFSHYWDAHFEGDATSTETLLFFSQANLDKILMFTRKVTL